MEISTAIPTLNTSPKRSKLSKKRRITPISRDNTVIISLSQRPSIRMTSFLRATPFVLPKFTSRLRLKAVSMRPRAVSLKILISRLSLRNSMLYQLPSTHMSDHPFIIILINGHNKLFDKLEIKVPLVFT